MSVGILNVIDAMKEQERLFCIPSYQRGYRWTEKQIVALLDDLEEFTESEEKIYCLQPLVLKTLTKAPTGCDNCPFSKFERVVDGQQRLTTLFLIFQEFHNEIPDHMWYEIEEKYISKTTSTSSDINASFRNQAREAITQWIGGNPKRKEAIRNLLSVKSVEKQVVFIEYHIGQNDLEQDVFNRLNSGKIPLTSAELIRALYMTDQGLSDEEKMEIAKEWELIEDSLRDPALWTMFLTEGRYESVRIDLLFSVISETALDQIKVEPLSTYYTVEKKITGKERALQLRVIWEKVLKCFWWMQSCKEDPEIHNYLGWLAIFTKNQVHTIYKIWEKDSHSDLQSFKEHLQTQIKEDGYLKLHNSLENIRYEDGNGNLKKLFVLLNILHCNRTKELFRFDWFQKQSWDIEHIDSQTENKLTEPETQKEWLRLSWQEMEKDERVNFQHEFEKFDGVEQNINNFDKKKQYIENMFSSDNLNDKNTVGNLVLLDSHTNRAYKNAIFPAKRRKILDELTNPQYIILPCTLNVFMKFYTYKPTILREWKQSDADAYQTAMEKLYNDFIQEK